METDSKRFKILIVDDNKEIHQDFIKILSLNKISSDFEKLDQELFENKEERPKRTLPDFEIDTASQGKEGVNLIKNAIKANKPYSLVFVDIRMPPGWDGVETIQHIWKVDPDIQVVICTAYSDYTWEETVDKLGTSENLLILKKPFDSVAVRQLAVALTKKWQLNRDTVYYTTHLESTVEQRTLSLQKSLSEIRATLESSKDGIIVLNNEGKVMDYNKRFTELWHLNPETLDSGSFDNIKLMINKQLINDFHFNQIVSETVNNEKTRMDKLLLTDGRVIEYYTLPQKLNEKKIGRVWSFSDITTQIQLEKTLEYQATHDDLTGLPNRVLLDDRIKSAIYRSERSKKKFGLLYCDLDRFKLVNDSLSHTAGDELLRQVADRISALIRKSDTLARMGGDEFIVLIADVNENVNLVNISQKILETLVQTFNIENNLVNISSSIGISIYPGDGIDPGELLRNADLAMYEAKQNGGGHFEFYTDTLKEHRIERFTIENELHKAIKNQEFFLVYQPQIDTISGKIVGVEALLRWQHPRRGLILPIEFIPTAEASGLMNDIGNWVTEMACKQLKQWQENKYPNIRMAINLSSNQINNPNFIDSLKEILARTDVDPQYLEFELTENILISQPKFDRVAKELFNLGIHLSFDDFGTGNSPINYLRKTAIERLKIDRSFVKNISINRNDEILIQAIISMARNLNLNVIAEGVETKEQVEFLKTQSCSDFQGLYFSGPLTSEEIEDLFKNEDDSRFKS